MNAPSQKKPAYPVQPALRKYLEEYSRQITLPVEYETLRAFSESLPLIDRQGRDTLWRTVLYPPSEMNHIHDGLRVIYALLRAYGDTSIFEHLRVDRVDFCEFGNSQPFRVRIVNMYNDNQDYFYVKKADASRVYGIELEHLLSPNRMLYFVWQNTMVEDHVVGIPGDQFMKDHLKDPGFKEIRIAKEFVKFNERCFIRLLGDMRSYNFVVDVTPDFEEVQYRIRPMDFDQQCYDGRSSYYRPQYFKENNPLIEFGMRSMDVKSMRQYQLEERALLSLRLKVEQDRIDWLLEAMRDEDLSPSPKVHQLRTGLWEYYHDASFLDCETMGQLLAVSLKRTSTGA